MKIKKSNGVEYRYIIEEFVEQGQHRLLAYIGKTFIGYIYFDLVSDWDYIADGIEYKPKEKDKYLWIREFRIYKEFRCHGYGTQLLKTFFSEIANYFFAYVKTVGLHVGPDYDAMTYPQIIEYYESFGFRLLDEVDETKTIRMIYNK